MNMYHCVLKTPQYENCEVLSPSGQLMFRCNNRKINWYLSRNLAVKIKDEPLTIQLTFIPKGQGHLEGSYYLGKMENLCVVCGVTDNLTRHHVVPKCYRKFFPSKNKEHLSYDVLPLCVNCHKVYEECAFEYKKLLSVKYNAPLEGEGFRYNRRLAQIKNIASTLLNYHEKIPECRREEMFSKLELELNRKICWEDLKELSQIKCHGDYIPHGKIVMESIVNLQYFIQSWRQHFLDNMKPKCLPPGWNVDHQI